MKLADIIRFTKEEKRVPLTVSLRGFSLAFSVPSEIRMDTPYLIFVATLRKKKQYGDDFIGFNANKMPGKMIIFSVGVPAYLGQFNVLWGRETKMSERNLP